MKRIGFIIILSLCSIAGFSQKAESYLTLGIGTGPTGMKYDLKGISTNGSSSIKWGGNIVIGYSYFFNKNWGVGTGIGVSLNRSLGKYDSDFSDSEFFNLGKQIDDDEISGNPREYELRVRLANWQEKQTAYFIEIPIVGQYQHRFRRYRQRFGIYGSAGIKLQIPVKTFYKVVDSEYANDKILNVSGFYESSGIDYGSVNNPAIAYHGFGKIHNPGEKLGWNGNSNLKLSIAGTAEFGLMINLDRRFDITIGGYIDYGFNNIKKGKDQLITAPEQYYSPDGNNNVGKGIKYNGMIKSDRIDKINLLSYGVKIGLRVKVDKLIMSPRFRSKF